MAMRVVDRLEAVDVDERDAERLRVARRALDLGAEGGEQRLAVGDAGEPVVRRTRLDLEEGAARRVQCPGQAAFAGDAGLARSNRLVSLERSLQVTRDAVQPPPEVAPSR